MPPKKVNVRMEIPKIGYSPHSEMKRSISGNSIAHPILYLAAINGRAGKIGLTLKKRPMAVAVTVVH
jgi:hypothetical protein